MAAYSPASDDIVKEAKDAFDLCTTNEAENRADALDDIRFARLEEQWPELERKRRELDGRPCMTFSKLAAFRRQVVNNARQNRPSIKVHPVDDHADPQVAEIYNGLIRNIETISDADVAYDTGMEGAVDGGLGYIRVNTRYASDDSFDLDLIIDPVVNPFSVWGDPYSTAHDSSDWNLSFVTDMLKKDKFKKAYPSAAPSDWDSSGYGSLQAPWIDGDQVMVAEYWKREVVARTILALSNGEIVGADVFKQQQDLFAQAGLSVIGEREVPSHKVTKYLLSGCEVLDEQAWLGKYIPIVPVYGDVVNVEGRRFLRSFIRSAKDGQRDYNYQRTTFIEKVALAPKVPYIGPKGAFKTDVDKWETANTDNHAYIEYDGAVAPIRQDMSTVAQGEMQGMLQASDDLKTILGLYDASMGTQQAQAAGQSGRAILALQRQGDTSTFNWTDNLSRAIRHTGRILIDLIPKVYTGPRILRVLGPDGVPSIVPVNQPVVQQPQAPNAPPGAQPQYVPAPQPQSPIIGGAAAPVPGQPPQPPEPQLPVQMFDLTAGKYDLVVEAGPSFATKREEAANQMIQLAQADPAILPIIGDILVKNLDWPGADEIVQRIQEQRQQAQQGGGQDAKAQAEAQATMAKLQAETQAKQAQMEQQAQLDQQKAAAAHELAMTQAQNDAALEKYKADQQIQNQRWMNEQTIELKRQTAAAELLLARESAQQSYEIELAEAKAKADKTVETPEWSVGGGIG